MEYIAYNYFQTPDEKDFPAIGATFMQSNFGITHAGKYDPPKKFSGNKKDLCQLIQKGTDLTNYIFLKSGKNKFEVTIEIHNDPRWEYSSFSISGPSRDTVEKLCISLKDVVNSYLCISGVLGQGSTQKWSFLYKSMNCPKKLITQISSNA